MHAHLLALLDMMARATGATPPPMITPMNSSASERCQPGGAVAPWRWGLTKPAHRNACLEEDDAEQSHHDTPDHNSNVVDGENLPLGGRGVDVGHVYID